MGGRRGCGAWFSGAATCVVCLAKLTPRAAPAVVEPTDDDDDALPAAEQALAVVVVDSNNSSEPERGRRAGELVGLAAAEGRAGDVEPVTWGDAATHDDK